MKMRDVYGARQGVCWIGNQNGACIGKHRLRQLRGHDLQATLRCPNEWDDTLSLE